jgi:hypothetical protein
MSSSKPHLPLTTHPTATAPKPAANVASYLPLRTVRVRAAIPVAQAVEQAPTLASLAALAQRSSDYLRLVSPLIPPSMRAAVQAGPLQGQQWCLIVANSAAAAKLRQLAPALAAHLRSQGYEVQEIRIKIAMRG